MGLHDWGRASENVFHTFHYGWLWNLAGLLNERVLPAGYVARPEEYVGPYQSDVLTLQTTEPEAVFSRERATDLAPVLTLSSPRLALRKERRIAILWSRNERRVAVIEIVSPGNKDSAPRAYHFQMKVVEFLESGLHVLIVDVLPGTPACRGFAAAIARVLGATEDPPVGPRSAASFEVSLEPPRMSLYARTLEVGRPLPDDVPLFLRPAEPVALPLEASYQATFERLPASDRASL